MIHILVLEKEIIQAEDSIHQFVCMCHLQNLVDFVEINVQMINNNPYLNLYGGI
jgi:hypothetical protein